MTNIKKEIKPILFATVVLFITCLIITFAVAFTNETFKERIAEQNAAARSASMKEIIEAEEYKAVEGLEDKDGEPAAYRAVRADGETLGYIFITATFGYGGDVQVMTGIVDGKVLSIQVTDCANETPGLGTEAAKSSFTDQFADKSGELEATTSAKEDNQIQALTGATITSKAVTASVNKALEMYAGLDEEG